VELESDRQKIDRELKERAIREMTVLEFLAAHSKASTHWYTGFLKSNLFAGIALWVLTQSVILIGSVIAFNYRVSSLTEWRAGVDVDLKATHLEIKSVDDKGTSYARHKVEEYDRTIGSLETHVKAIEDDTKHLDVLEFEHRRLTEDVEKLKNGKK
jgi:hypothetical protein